MMSEKFIREILIKRKNALLFAFKVLGHYFIFENGSLKL